MEREKPSSAPGAGQARSEAEVLLRLTAPLPPSERYRIEAELARGGQGAVLQVWDRNLQRQLAMKVAHDRSPSADPGADPATPRSVARFLEEAQVTSQLDHPGIVPLHELGVDTRGHAYFTMKLVRGKTLKEVFAEFAEGTGGWTEGRVLAVLLKVCEAMSYAHAKGVVHRDLKPGNVMVGRFGEVYVMDWGLAKVLGRPENRDLRIRPEPTATGELRSRRHRTSEDSPDSPLVTLDGDVVGTPIYMSPEQASGRGGALGPQSDVYSLGAMLYHLLARRPPYVLPEVRPNNYAILCQVQDGPPTPLRKLAPRAPPELVAICDKAMARAVEERYRDMGELAADLAAFLEHRVVHAYETGAVAELRKWIARNRGLAAALLSGLLALTIGLASSLRLWARSERHAALAHENESRAMENERRALAGEALARGEKERAEANERRALESERQATQRAEQVRRLAALQKLEDLEAEAAGLWPAAPENEERFVDWLARAEALVAELPEHREQREEYLAKAQPLTERAEYRALDPLRRRLAVLRQRTAVLESGDVPADPSPAEAGLDLAALPIEAGAIEALAWPLVAPGRDEWGREGLGILLARHALERAAPLERAGIRVTLAWSLFGLGRLDEASDEIQRALEEATSGERGRIEARAAEFHAALERDLSPAGIEATSAQIARLEAELAAREREVAAVPHFADAYDKWWYRQLEKLVAGLERFSDAEVGLLSRGVSAEYGWGIQRRLDFARDLRTGFAGGAHERAWLEVLPAIRERYPGLALRPQLGLVPLGPDPESGLWEFAHLQTGAPARRGAGGRLELREEYGLVFVLLPAGSFWMGAQRHGADKTNHDPEAENDEEPVHQVELSAFFLSKYEMTQAQWARIAGHNPSVLGPEGYLPFLDRRGSGWSGLHPVENVNWTQCSEILERLGLSLPSEAQWEYACRAGSRDTYGTGPGLESLRGAANVADAFGRANGGDSWPAWEETLDDGHTAHAEIGRFRPNAFGLHDMQGNVWEWCLDLSNRRFYAEGPRQDPVCLSGSATRVTRGGGFSYTAFHARPSNRDYSAESFAEDDLGLRPALGIKP